MTGTSQRIETDALVNTMQIYHADDLVISPRLVTVGSCDEEPEFESYDWDEDEKNEITCRLYDYSRFVDGAITSSH